MTHQSAAFLVILISLSSCSCLWFGLFNTDECRYPYYVIDNIFPWDCISPQAFKVSYSPHFFDEGSNNITFKVYSSTDCHGDVSGYTFENNDCLQITLDIFDFFSNKTVTSQTYFKWSMKASDWSSKVLCPLGENYYNATNANHNIPVGTPQPTTTTATTTTNTIAATTTTGKVLMLPLATTCPPGANGRLCRFQQKNKKK